ANKVGEMSKYSLNLRHVKQKQQPKRPPLGAPFGFNDDEEKDVEGQQKKALEEDPTVFDYDGVYDKIKEEVSRPLIQDRKERKVTKDFLHDFYTTLDKIVAHGAQDPRGRKHENRAEQRTAETCESGSQGNP
ncbi:hypothetical protein S83_042309, partial [Arachis hypogaea]